MSHSRAYNFAAAVALAAVVCTVSIAAGAQATSPPPPAPVIVMVDMQQLIYGSKAGKDVQAQIDAQRQAYSKDVAQQEDQLQKARAELERQRAAMAPDVLDAKAREFQQKVEALDRGVQAKQRAWQQSYTDAMSKIENVALQIVAEIAAEHQANLVIQKAAVIFGKDGFDITAEAVQRIDQRLPSVVVNPPKEGDNTNPAAPAQPQGQASKSK